jgi:hypothetical protein
MLVNVNGWWIIEIWFIFCKDVVVFRFNLSGFVVEVCFLPFVVYLGVVYEEVDSRYRVAFYVSTF